jgi:TonB family protein
MGSNWRLPIRLGLGWAILVAATPLFGADGPSTTAPDPQIIPARRATKFLIHNVRPEYPAIARMNYIQGKVNVQALVDDEGKVKEAHVVTGHPLLAVSALKAIRSWIFKPARSRQGPPIFLTFVEVNFSLQSRQVLHIPDKPDQYLSRQVLQPQVMEKPAGGKDAVCVRLRVLVGADGRAVDSIATAAGGRGLSDARQAVSTWTFRPARWGAIAIPWYLEVEVPVNEPETSLTDRAAAKMDIRPNEDR